jgi:para-nitrobenzyl esterase
MRKFIFRAVLIASLAPATLLAAAAYSSDGSEIGALMDNAATRAILEKLLPEVAKSEYMDMIRGLTLRTLQGYSPDKVTDKTLTEIDAELAKLASSSTTPVVAPNSATGASGGATPAAAPLAAYTTADTSIGDLIDNPALRELLDKHFPGFSQKDGIDQGRPMTLKSVQQYVPELTDKALAELDADLAKVAAKK